MQGFLSLRLIQIMHVTQDSVSLSEQNKKPFRVCYFVRRQGFEP